MRRYQKYGRRSRQGPGFGTFLLVLLVIAGIVIWRFPEIRKKAVSLIEQGYSAIQENQIDYGSTTEGIPEYSGKAFCKLNDNKPLFTEKEKEFHGAFEKYSPLDKLGRCGPAMACLTWELAPTEERQPIGMIKPTGWHTVRYDDLIADKYLYNRCHLIAFCLAGENANEKNLITGTRYMNTEGMLPFEILLAEYIDDHPNSPVLYRATPIYEGDNLVASGVELEAYSLEDDGRSICFHVFCYNVQPGIEIDYATGKSQRK